MRREYIPYRLFMKGSVLVVVASRPPQLIVLFSTRTYLTYPLTRRLIPQLAGRLHGYCRHVVCTLDTAGKKREQVFQIFIFYSSFPSLTNLLCTE